MNHAIHQGILVFAVAIFSGMAVGFALRPAPAPAREHLAKYAGVKYAGVSGFLIIASLFGADLKDSFTASPGLTEVTVDIGLGCVAFAAGVSDGWLVIFARLGWFRSRKPPIPPVSGSKRNQGVINGEQQNPLGIGVEEKNWYS